MSLAPLKARQIERRSQHSTRSRRLAGRIVVLAAGPHRDAGRAHGFCGGVSHPNQPMDGASIDLIRERIEERCRELLAMPVRSEVILTATPPFSTTGAS